MSTTKKIIQTSTIISAIFILLGCNNGTTNEKSTVSNNTTLTARSDDWYANKKPISADFQITDSLILNAYSRKAIDAGGGNAQSGDQIHQWDINNEIQQKWDITPVVGAIYAGNQLFKIKAHGKDLVIDGVDELKPLIVNQFNGKDEQLWTIYDNGDGSFSFLNMVYPRAYFLDLENCDKNNGTKLGLNYANYSTCSKIFGNSNDYYSSSIRWVIPTANKKSILLRNMYTRKVVNLLQANDGAQVQQLDQSNSAFELWNLTQLNENIDGVPLYKITTQKDGQEWALNNSDSNSVKISKYDNQIQQKWRITNLGNDVVKIIAANDSSKVLDLAQCSYDGVGLKLKSVNDASCGSDSQQWLLDTPLYEDVLLRSQANGIYAGYRDDFNDYERLVAHDVPSKYPNGFYRFNIQQKGNGYFWLSLPNISRTVYYNWDRWVFARGHGQQGWSSQPFAQPIHEDWLLDFDNDLRFKTLWDVWLSSKYDASWLIYTGSDNIDWIIVPYRLYDAKRLFLTNGYSDLVVDTNGALGNNVTLTQKENVGLSPSQLFDIQFIGEVDKGDPLYKIVINGQSLAITDSGATAATRQTSTTATLSDYSGQKWQKWKIYKTEDGFYKFKNVYSNRFLGLASCTLAIGAKLSVSDTSSCFKDSTHKWRISDAPSSVNDKFTILNPAVDAVKAAFSNLYVEYISSLLSNGTASYNGKPLVFYDGQALDANSLRSQPPFTQKSIPDINKTMATVHFSLSDIESVNIIDVKIEDAGVTTLDYANSGASNQTKTLSGRDYSATNTTSTSTTKGWSIGSEVGYTRAFSIGFKSKNNSLIPDGAVIQDTPLRSSAVSTRGAGIPDRPNGLQFKVSGQWNQSSTSTQSASQSDTISFATQSILVPGGCHVFATAYMSTASIQGEIGFTSTSSGNSYIDVTFDGMSKPYTFDLNVPFLMTKGAKNEQNVGSNGNPNNPEVSIKSRAIFTAKSVASQMWVREVWSDIIPNSCPNIVEDYGFTVDDQGNRSSAKEYVI